MLPCVCSVIDHRGRQNVVKCSDFVTTVSHCKLYNVTLYDKCML